MLRIEVKEENNVHKVEFEAKIIGYDKAVEQLATLFTTLYKNIPERILAEALDCSDWESIYLKWLRINYHNSYLYFII